MHGHTVWHFQEEATLTLLSSVRHGVGPVVVMVEGMSVCVCGMIYHTNKCVAADPSALRETLSGCLSVILQPRANTAGHLQLNPTKERATCPQRALLSHSI